PQPLSESGHGVMIAHFRGVLADPLEARDLLERQVSRHAQGDDRPLARGKLPDEPSQVLTQRGLAHRGIVLRQGRLRHLVERHGALAPAGPAPAARLIFVAYAPTPTSAHRAAAR